MAEHMLTTIDNPYDPYTEFDEWNAYDRYKGYHTLAYLARVTRTSHEISESDDSLAIEIAIDEIVKENVLGIYKKVEVPSTNEYEYPALSMIE